MFEVDNIVNEQVKKYVKSELKGFNWSRVDVINLSQGITIIHKLSDGIIIILDFFNYILIITHKGFTFYGYYKDIDKKLHYFEVNNPELLF